MRRALLPLTLSLGLLGCPSQPVPPLDPEPPAPAALGLAAGLTVTQVTVNQGVAVALLDGDEALLPEDRNGPLLTGRDALLRVFVQPDAGFEPRDVTARLSLGSHRAELTQLVSGPSDAGDPGSTFDFEVPGDTISADATWSVQLFEADGQAREGATAGAAFPRDDGDLLPDAEPLFASDWGATLRVTVIPVRYDADGSGRLPELSEEQQDLYADTLVAMYPLRELDIAYDEPWATDVEFTSSGDGFSDVLEAMRDVRAERDIPWDRYVYALVQPRDDRDTFCRFGCTLGLSYLVANPSQSRVRVSVGAGFPGEEAAFVMAHELGHAHDRQHAPCGNASGVDERYPYEGGGTGVWGWNARTGQRFPPESSTDVMGYCDGKWISDYQYAGLHERIARLEGLDEPRPSGEGRDWLRVSVRPQGLKGATPEALVGEPGGRPVTVELSDAEGLREVQGHFAPFAHGGGGTLLVPAEHADADKLRFGGFELDLR